VVGSNFLWEWRSQDLVETTPATSSISRLELFRANPA
jgi:hypothetical protein